MKQKRMRLKFLSIYVPQEKVVVTKDNFKQIVRSYFRELGYADRETMWVIMLNNSKLLLGVDLISVGSVCQNLFTPTELFRKAIYKNATNLILVHNHPSLNCEPSQLDLSLISKVSAAAKLLGIDIEAVVILAGDKMKVIKNKKLKGTL